MGDTWKILFHVTPLSPTLYINYCFVTHTPAAFDVSIVPTTVTTTTMLHTIISIHSVSDSYRCENMSVSLSLSKSNNNNFYFLLFLDRRFYLNQQKKNHTTHIQIT